MACPRCQRSTCETTDDQLMFDWYSRGWDDLLKEAWKGCALRAGDRLAVMADRVAELESELTVLHAHARANRAP